MAAFLGGLHRSLYWPLPGLDGRPQPRSVADAVRGAFRCSPEEEPSLEGAFQGLRYLSALLAVAERHGMATGAASSSAASMAAPIAASSDTQQWQQQQQQQVSSQPPQPSLQSTNLPDKGCLLLAHPALGGWFSRAVVLLCAHEPTSGSYGLALNKPLGSSMRHLGERIASLRSGAAAGSGGGAAATAPLQALRWREDESRQLVGELMAAAAAADDDNDDAGIREEPRPAAAAAAAAAEPAAPAAAGDAAAGLPAWSGEDGDVSPELLQAAVDQLAWERERGRSGDGGLLPYGPPGRAVRLPPGADSAALQAALSELSQELGLDSDDEGEGLEGLSWQEFDGDAGEGGGGGQGDGSARARKPSPAGSAAARCAASSWPPCQQAEPPPVA